jgi:hypothetical protein
MASETFSEKVQALKEANTNTVRGSKVRVEAEHAPKLYFRPETGELIVVPVAESNAFNAEIGEWNSLVATLHAANEQVQYLEDHITKLALKPNLAVPSAREIAERNLESAIEWQEAVFDTCRAKVESLAKIGSSGKQLVELIPISTENPVRKESKPAEFDGSSYKKEQKISSAKGAKTGPSKDWIRPPAGSFVYVTSDKIKSHWPTFKDPENLKWQDVVARDDNGKRKLDSAKAKNYANHLVKKIKLESKDWLKIETDTEGAIGIWATMWNTDTANKFSRKGSGRGGSNKPTIELDAGAQFMRYLYGASLEATFEPFKGNVSIRAEGHAEFAIAEAKAAAAIYFPCKEGWMWTMPGSLFRGSAEAKDADLGAVRFMASLELKGAVGASVAIEGSLDIETKEGQMPMVKGAKTRKRGKRRAKKVQVADELGAEEKTRVAGFDAGLNVFAGIKADAELKGAIEWRNPEDPEKRFEAFATVAPSLGGLAGIGGSAKLTVQYSMGIFRIHADAGLCIGLGAEGKLSFEVSAKLLAKFIKWFFYQLYHVNYRCAEFIAESAFKMAKYISFISIATGKDISTTFGTLEAEMKRNVDKIASALTKPDARRRLAQRILSEPEALRYAPPETKSMLIYQLCNARTILGESDNLRVDESFLKDQREAVSYLLKRWSHTRSDFENVVQHISEDGNKRNYDENLVLLREFFKEGVPYHIDGSGAPGLGIHDFDEWHKSILAELKEEPTRGFPIVPSDSVEYAMQRDTGRDHPLFASTGDFAFYS